MPKLLLNDAVKYYHEQGHSGITKHFLYTSCKAGKLPHFKAGNRIIIDTEEVDMYLKRLQEESISGNNEAEVLQFGKLRRVNA